MSNLSLVLKYAAGLVLLLVLSFFTYAGKVSGDVLVGIVTAAFGALGVHAVGGRSADVPSDKQSGFIRLPLLLIGAALACVLMISGCATTSAITGKSQAQIAADIQSAGERFCTVAQPTLVTLQALSLDADAAASVATAQGVVAVVCKAGAVIASGDLQTIANSALPALVKAIKASSLSDDDKNTAIVGATVANVAVNSALAQ